MQVPDILSGIGLEQPGTQRLGEGRIVDGERQIGSGLLAGAVPRRADLLAVEEDAVVGRVLRVRSLGGQDGDFDVEGERADAAEEAVLGQTSTVFLCRSC